MLPPQILVDLTLHLQNNSQVAAEHFFMLSCNFATTSSTPPLTVLYCWSARPYVIDLYASGMVTFDRWFVLASTVGWHHGMSTQKPNINDVTKRPAIIYCISSTAKRKKDILTCLCNVIRPVLQCRMVLKSCRCFLFAGLKVDRKDLLFCSNSYKLIPVSAKL